MQLLTPKLLDFQPESEDGLQFYTHFECWNDYEDERPSGRWAWNSGKAVNLVWKLMRQAWALTNDEEYMHFAEKYLALGQVEFFDCLAEMFVKSGYHVYNSYDYFEVYDPEFADVSEDEGK